MKRPSPGANNKPNIGVKVERCGIKPLATDEISPVPAVPISPDWRCFKLDTYLLKK